MSVILARAGLRAWRVGKFSRLVRLKTVWCVLGFATLAAVLLVSGVLQGSLARFRLPPSGVRCSLRRR